MPHASQCTTVSAGAVASSMVTASERVPRGGGVQNSAGEVPSPSQPCRAGISAPCANVVLVRTNASGTLVPNHLDDQPIRPLPVGLGVVDLLLVSGVGAA